MFEEHALPAIFSRRMEEFGGGAGGSSRSTSIPGAMPPDGPKHRSPERAPLRQLDRLVYSHGLTRSGTKMDPFTTSTLAGLLVNTLSAMAGGARAVVAGRVKPSEIELLQRDPDFEHRLQRIAEFSSSPAVRLKVHSFLESPEGMAVLRRIFAHLEMTRSNALSVEVREDIIRLLATQISESQHTAREFARVLWDAAEHVLTYSGYGDTLTQAARHGAIVDELVAVKKLLAVLDKQNPDVPRVLEFEARYREEVGARHSEIVPPHFDSAKRVPINRLYVNAILQPTDSRDDRSDSLSTEQFLTAVYRAVVLGNPGAGKTTLAQKICHDMAERYGERPFGGRSVTPIMVVLREFGATKKSRPCSIIEFIASQASYRYQLQPPVGAFEYLLLAGRAIVIFDGMDELLDSSYRREITGDIESFCRSFPSVPVIVTSRQVGYEQAPLDPRRFESFHLAPFGEREVLDYAEKWFSLDSHLAPDECSQKAHGFMRESKTLEDLRSNPLMLALMCNIYRGENSIPRNRPDIYEKCATMLFERWDTSRGIPIESPIKTHTNATMAYVAYWIYSNESLQAGVSEQALISKAADYLCSWRFEDRDEAESAATRFIELCRGRAWVLTDTGTTAHGERLFQFTHRTFLEYYAASHLVRTNDTSQSLSAALLPRIRRREWDVVAQLAFQLKSKSSEGAADDLLSAGIEASGLPVLEQGNSLSFAARCLEFMVPRPAMVRRITEMAIEFIVRPEPLTDRTELTTEIVIALMQVAPENRNLVRETFVSSMVSSIGDSDPMTSRRAIHVSLSLASAIGSTEIDLRSLAQLIISSSKGHMAALALLDVPTAVEFYRIGELSLAMLLNWHGPSALFAFTQSEVFNAARPPIVHDLLSCVTNPVRASRRLAQQGTESEVDIEDLLSLGPILPEHKAPWIRRPQATAIPTGFLELELLSRNDTVARAMPMQSIWFPAFLLVAPLWELALSAEEPNDWRELLARESLDDLPFGHLARARTGDRRAAIDIVKQLHLPPDQFELVRNWCSRELHFVEKRRKTKVTDIARRALESGDDISSLL
jgi:hypothetical protein